MKKFFFSLKEEETRNKTYPKGKHLKDFLDIVNSLGVSLSVWKGKTDLEWTSLLGGEKRRLLRKLPQHFGKFLPTGKVIRTQSLWEVFKMPICKYIHEKLHLHTNKYCYSFHHPK